MVKPAVKLCTGRDETEAVEKRKWKEMRLPGMLRHPAPTELTPLDQTHMARQMYLSLVSMGKEGQCNISLDLGHLW